MDMKKLQKNRIAIAVLLGGYVAVESFYLSGIAGWTIAFFWDSRPIFDILSVLVAYLIMDAIFMRSKMSPRKKVIIAGVVLFVTFILSVVATLFIGRYLQATQI